MAHATGKNYINEEPGLASWFTTLDHKRIAILYYVSVMCFFFGRRNYGCFIAP